VTVDERRVQLRDEYGMRPEEVDDVIASESAGGVWCDGTIVIDERGRRCVSRAQAERVQRARQASPLAESDDSPGLVGALVVVALVVVFCGVLVAVER
jgi:hypothetical protein